MKVAQLLEGFRYGTKEKSMVGRSLDAFNVEFTCEFTDSQINEDTKTTLPDGLVSKTSDSMSTITTVKPVSGTNILKYLEVIHREVSNYPRATIRIELSHTSQTLDVGKFITLSELFKFTPQTGKGNAYQYIIDNIDDIISTLVKKNLNVIDKPVGDILHDYVEDNLERQSRVPLVGKYGNIPLTANINSNSTVDITITDVTHQLDDYVDLLYRIMFTILVTNNEKFDNEYKKITIRKINKAFELMTGIHVNDAIYNSRRSVELMQSLTFRSPYDVSDIIQQIIHHYDGDERHIMSMINDLINSNKNKAVIKPEYYQVLTILKRDRQLWDN